MQKVVSQMDIYHLEVIRKNVESFIRYCSLQYNNGTSNKLLDIAPQDYHGAKAFFKCEVKTLDINPDSGADYIADICQNNQDLINDNSFDFVLCTEVLEHTLNPFKAIDELYRVLKPGGLLFLSVPFNFRIHGPLPDCWRFTEHGLRALLSNFAEVSIKEISTDHRDLMPIHYTVIANK